MRLVLVGKFEFECKYIYVEGLCLVEGTRKEVDEEASGWTFSARDVYVTPINKSVCVKILLRH